MGLNYSIFVFLISMTPCLPRGAAAETATECSRDRPLAQPIRRVGNRNKETHP